MKNRPAPPLFHEVFAVMPPFGLCPVGWRVGGRVRARLMPAGVRWAGSVGGGGSAAVVEADGPDVAGQGDADAPGDGGDGVRADRAAGEQAADRLGDGGEGLVFGELA